MYGNVFIGSGNEGVAIFGRGALVSLLPLFNLASAFIVGNLKWIHTAWSSLPHAVLLWSLWIYQSHVPFKTFMLDVFFAWPHCSQVFRGLALSHHVNLLLKCHHLRGPFRTLILCPLCIHQGALGANGDKSIQTSSENKDVVCHIIEGNGSTDGKFSCSVMSSGTQVCPTVLLLLLVDIKWLQNPGIICKHNNAREKTTAPRCILF